MNKHRTQQTVKSFPALSLSELGNTLCEHLNGFTPNGKLQTQTCLTVLDVMEKGNLITLPAKAKYKPGRQEKIEHTEQSNEAAQTHLQALQKENVVIDDRGYFSYVMYSYHLNQNTHAVFRLKRNITPVIDDFINSKNTHQVVEFIPSKKHQRAIRAAYPQIEIKPLKLRLIKYHVLATTLLDDQRYPANEFSDLYHARWGVEELYKIYKKHIDVEGFHGKTKRGVKQERYAHFVLVTLTRLFANHAAAGFGETTDKDKSQPFKVNFKNCLTTIARNLEALFLKQAMQVKKTLNKVMATISACRQRVRPNRSYERRSRKPTGKWQPPKEKRIEQITTA